MPMVFPYLYLARPRAELVTWAAQFPVAPWYARPHIWSIPAVGNHDHPEQMRGVEEDLKWFVLAAVIADDEEPAAKELATSLLPAPRRIELFDRLWELEPAGNFIWGATADDVGAPAMLAVASTAGAAGPSSWWLAQIQLSEERAARRATAVEWALERIHRRFEDLLPDRRCRLRPSREHERATIEAALGRAGWTLDRRAALGVTLSHTSAVDSIEVAFEISRREDGRARAEELARGQVAVELADREGRAEVAAGWMTICERIELPVD